MVCFLIMVSGGYYLMAIGQENEILRIVGGIMVAIGVFGASAAYSMLKDRIEKLERK